MECIFCKIIKKEAPADFVYEDDKIIGIKDIHPKAPFHVLIIPKEHIASLNELENKELIGDLAWVARKIAKDKNLNSYKLLINVGRAAGQLIDHLHLHLLSR